VVKTTEPAERFGCEVLMNAREYDEVGNLDYRRITVLENHGD
jgi:hypothetical protein